MTGNKWFVVIGLIFIMSILYIHINNNELNSKLNRDFNPGVNIELKCSEIDNYIIDNRYVGKLITARELGNNECVVSIR